MINSLAETFQAMFSDNPGMTELLAISLLELAAIILGMVTFGISYANSIRNRRRARQSSRAASYHILMGDAA